MIDKHNRNVHYLRLSVTDLCNLRCTYCMPESGVTKLDHKEILTFEEIEEIVATSAELGVNKVRLTGGEPLVRRGIETIVEKINDIEGINDIGMTTNAVLLPQKAEALRNAGLKRLNISLDTLDADKYEKITRGGSLKDALKGIDAALKYDFNPIKLNVVLMGGVNDDEIVNFIEFSEKRNIHVRFIEIMPIGECACWNQERFIDASTVITACPELEFLEDDGVAKLYRRPGQNSTVGLINPISSRFCGDCNKIRITADGKLKPCLHSSEEIILKGKHSDELKNIIENSIYEKPMRHKLDTEETSGSARNMNAIGG